MSAHRLFLALPLPSAVRALVAGLADTTARPLRWTRPEELHLTLRFIGDTDSSLIDPLTARLDAIRVEPFLLALESAGTFPTRGSPRVLWVGVAPADPRLLQLRQQVDDSLLALGLDADLRTFHPHVTLARCSETAAGPAGQWVRQHRDFAGPPFLVDSFDLLSSELHPDGARSTLLARFPLAK